MLFTAPCPRNGARHPHRNRSGPLLLVLCTAVVTALGCDKPYREFPKDQVCRDVGYAISARTFECTDDPELAEARFDAFLEQYTCGVQSLQYDPIDVWYHCVAKINEVGCDNVTTWKEDLSQYLLQSPTCRDFLTGPGLDAIPETDAAADAGADAATDATTTEVTP